MKWTLLLFGILLASCAQQPEVVSKGNWRKSPSAWVSGAEVYSNVETLSGVGALAKEKLVYRAGTHALDGPLRWQFVAESKSDQLVSMRVAAVQISTQKSARSVSLPAELLGGENPFVLEQLTKEKKSKFSFKKMIKMGEEESEKDAVDSEVDAPTPRWLASFTVPDILQLFPKADGRVTVAAKIVVTNAGGEQVSEWVNFALLPAATKSQSFEFRQTMVEYGGVPID